MNRLANQLDQQTEPQHDAVNEAVRFLLQLAQKTTRLAPSVSRVGIVSSRSLTMPRILGATALYDSDLVDQTALILTLQLLTKYRASFERLDSVALELLKYRYPLTETYRWLNNDPPPPDLVEKSNQYMNYRDLAVWFWQRLARHSYGPVQQRLPWGIQEFMTTHHDQVVAHLTKLPFDSAINTWLAVSETWLQICPVSPAWIAYSKQRGCIKIDADIPHCLASYMEMFTW